MKQILKIDKKRVNDPEYMAEKIKENYRLALPRLGEDLATNEEYILNLISSYRFYAPFIEFVDPRLQNNTKFLIKFIKKFVENSDYDVKTIISHMPKQILEESTEFWSYIREEYGLGGIYTYKIPIEMQTKQKNEESNKRKESVLKRAELLTGEEFLRVTTSVDRYDDEFMLKMISKNEKLWEVFPRRFKYNEELMKKAEKMNPKITEFIKKRREERKIALEAILNNKKKEEEGRLVAEYKELGEGHPKLILVKRFLESSESRQAFCEKNNIDMSELKAILKEVVFIYPELREKIDNKAVKCDIF